ncbi:MAG: signal peptide peptidase SppA [Alphaproteobacteria bacterium]|nr:signal peptide peptidase SppA [Alphaproteobacteria bacterium]
MNFNRNAFFDHQRLLRKVTLWRALFFLYLFLSLPFFFFSLDEKSSPGYPHIAHVSIDGFIDGDHKLLSVLDEIASDEEAKALLLSIDSPGGSTAGSEAIYDKVRKISKSKPVVAVMGNVAASGGYIVALASDHIIARRNSLTGSIGVIFQWQKFDKLIDNLGISVEEVKSGVLKAEPGPFTKTPQEVFKVLKEMVDESYDWFLGLVSERRGMDMVQARLIGNGRVYTGGQAFKLNLIDAIGGDEEAREWLSRERGIKDLKVEEWGLHEPDKSLFELLLNWLDLLEISSLFSHFSSERSVAFEGGLLSVLHIPRARFE